MNRSASGRGRRWRDGNASVHHRPAGGRDEKRKKQEEKIKQRCRERAFEKEIQIVGVACAERDAGDAALFGVTLAGFSGACGPDASSASLFFLFLLYFFYLFFLFVPTFIALSLSPCLYKAETRLALPMYGQAAAAPVTHSETPEKTRDEIIFEKIDMLKKTAQNG